MTTTPAHLAAFDAVLAAETTAAAGAAAVRLFDIAEQYAVELDRTRQVVTDQADRINNLERLNESTDE